LTQCRFFNPLARGPSYQVAGPLPPNSLDQVLYKVYVSTNSKEDENEVLLADLVDRESTVVSGADDLDMPCSSERA
jgi:hypothetical protein